jgi:hypothetical protein
MIAKLNRRADDARVVRRCVPVGQAVGLDGSRIEPQVFTDLAPDSISARGAVLFHDIDTVLG